MDKVLTVEPSRSQIMLFGVEWPRFMKSSAGMRKTSRLSIIAAEISASDIQTDSLVQRIILEKDLEKKHELVMEFVSVIVRESTGLSSRSETDLNKSLYSYGIESSSALTLKMQIEANLQISFEVSCIYFPLIPPPPPPPVNIT